MRSATDPTVQTSLSQPQICIEAFCADPGSSCVLDCAINAHNLSDVSDIAAGPFKLAEDKIEWVVSIASEYSNKPDWSTTFIRLHADLDVTGEENARAAKSTTRGQWIFSSGDFAAVPLAILFKSESA
jgi:hypothetical protein